MILCVFLLGHWYSSLLLQSFFHHRYCAHRQFRMSKRWEHFFHGCVYVAQGASYLDPRGYTILHRLHHAHSDTPLDPHSPRYHRDVLSLTWSTKRRYDACVGGEESGVAMGDAETFGCELINRVGSTWTARLLWMVAYTAIYVELATSAWIFALLPLHFLISPVQGALVNWCGHRYGYRNFATSDGSRNSLRVDLLAIGELLQNNHHRFPHRANFAVREIELDLVHPFLRALSFLRVIELTEDRTPPLNVSAARA